MTRPPLSSPSTALPPPSSLHEVAVLSLDRDGRVLQANRTAGELWQIDRFSLIGRSFPDLFQLEVVSQDPLFHNAQWEVLLATAGQKPIELLARRPDEQLVAVVARIEAFDSGTTTHLALVEPAPLATPRNEASSDAPKTGAAESENLLEILRHNSALAFFDFDAATGALQRSGGWHSLLGYPADELDPTYDSWLQLLHPEDSAAAPDQVGRSALPGERRDLSAEFRLRHRQGHWVWVQACGVQQFSTVAKLERVVGVLIDISERKDLEEAGLLAEDRLMRLSSEGRLALFDVDLTTAMVSLSRAWHHLVGRATDEESPGQSFARGLGLAEPAQWLERFRTAPAGERWFVESTKLHHAQGAQVPVWLAGHRQLNRKGEVSRVVGVALAAPHRHASADPELVLAALTTLNEAVIIGDERGRILHMNTKAEQMTGHRLDAIRQRPLHEVFRLVTARDAQPSDDAVNQAIASDAAGRLHTEHALLSTAGGAPRSIVWSASEIVDAAQQAAGIVVVFRDPAEMSLTPEELVRANRFESLGQLAGGIAHDFNNLLTTILGGISYARDNHDYAHLADAEAACTAAATLTRQLLAFARGSRGGLRQVVRPADFLRDAVRLATAGATAQVHVDVAEDAGPVQVDRGQMLQVFQNLIINALQAMPEQRQGQIWLRCRNVPLEEGQLPPLGAGQYVQIEVQDNACGIPPEILDRIFDPFFTTKKQGTGLGLATVLTIVRQHGGQLGVDSTVGVGTTFTTFLPVSEQAVETTTRRGPSLRFGTGRILFMDDDPKIADLTVRMLDSLEYTHDVAKNGEEAIALYRRYLNVHRPYDVVILDMTIIGGMGGEECFQTLRELDPDVRAIVTSGYDSEDMARKYLDMGFVGYLTKPYRVSDLSRVLKSVLARRSGTRASTASGVAPSRRTCSRGADGVPSSAPVARVGDPGPRSATAAQSAHDARTASGS